MESRSILWIGLKQIAENRWYMSMLFGVYAGIINTHSFSFSQALCMSMKVFFFIHLAFLNEHQPSDSLSSSWALPFFPTCMVARARLWPRVAASPHNTCVVLKIIESTHPVAASGCFSRVAASGRFCRVAASGRFCRVAASGCFSRVAASGLFCRVVGSGRKWLLLSSGRKWPLLSSGREWPQVAAFSFFNFHPQCDCCDIAVLELLDTGINSFSCFVLLSSLSKQKLEVNHFCQI